MKRIIAFTCLILSALSLYARAIQEDYKKAEEKARVSYAFGMAIGANLSSTELEFDYRAFADGMRDVLGNTQPQFSEQEAYEIIETALQDASRKKAEENMLREVEFLARNMERAGVYVTSSGLQYEIITAADGEKPAGDSVVRVYYSGEFIDGAPFDKSDEEEGAYIPLDMVIPGWTEGLLLMSPGSKYKFYIPSELAYGRDGIQSIIPPYSTLVFTVELLEIIDKEDDDY